MAPLTDSNISEILRIIDESSLDELRVGGGLTFSAPRGARGVPGVPVDEASDGGLTVSADGRRTPASEGVIASPMLGTLYRARGQGKTEVNISYRVSPAAVVGIVEVMKMMNSCRRA